MKKSYLFTFIVIGSVIFSACNSGYTRRNPGRIYAPDMTYSRAYDAYTETDSPMFASGTSRLVSQPPVPGTVARGEALPHHLTEADSNAYAALTNPYTFTDQDMEEGQRLFDIYCAICHGTDLGGDGPLYTSGKFAAMPANLKDPKFVAYSGGKIFYTIMYGKNMMGSYASQLDDKQKWKVISFIKKQQGGDAAATPAATDSTASPAVAVAK
jgi:mono/diheme cytochrome c family protein